MIVIEKDATRDKDMMVELGTICHQGDVGKTTICGKTVDEILEQHEVNKRRKRRFASLFSDSDDYWTREETKRQEKIKSMKLELIRTHDKVIPLFPESFPRPLLYSLLDAITENGRLPDLKEEWLALHPNADAMHLMTFTSEISKSVLARLTHYDGVSGVRFERIQGYRDTNMKSPAGHPDPQDYSRREVMKPEFKVEIRNDFVVVVYSFLYNGKRHKIGLATTSTYFNRIDGLTSGFDIGTTFVQSSARAEAVLTARITDQDIKSTHELSVSDYIKQCRENLKKVVD